MNKRFAKRSKYIAGCVAMAACWLVGHLTLFESAAILPNIALETESRECATHKVQSELELPSEYETLGIDLLLFEPLPEPQKTTRKARNEKQKVRNKAGQSRIYRVNREMNKNKSHCKLNFGGGGIKCPCCRLSHSIKESRTKLNRALRRKSKQNVEKEVDSGDSVE